MIGRAHAGAIASRLVLLLGVGAAWGCATAGPRLSPDRAEFPLGNAVVVDGRIDPEEWQHARRTSVTLVDGSLVEILLQRDRSHFYFAFVGLADRPLRPVHPEILMDLWADGGRSLREDDWWFSVTGVDCQAQGSIGGDDCAREQGGWWANNLPLGRGEAVEVAIQFRMVGASENYEDPIGLAFRFLQKQDEVGIWPLGASAAWPESWARLSLRH